MVRAYPAELRGVEDFLKAMQVVVERQVMLEAKIIEVQLSDRHQTGVNWAAFTPGFEQPLRRRRTGPGCSPVPERADQRIHRSQPGWLGCNQFHC